MTNANYKKEFTFASNKKGSYFSIPELASKHPNINKLPVSLRIVLESLLRNWDGSRVSEEDVINLSNWKAKEERTSEIPFVVARVLLQDFTGVPLGVDLAAMRDAVKTMQKDPSVIEPLVPVDLVIDHSVQVDYSGIMSAFKKNLDIEFERNESRYQFLKWCMGAFKSFKVVPPGIGICHQVNLEYLAKGVLEKDSVYYPDTLVGTDSHTTMINGLGVVGWGVGGIEAEAAMLGQPVYFLTPDVVGVNLTGALKEGVTATDVVLTITEMLRKAKVVGKFVEFFGEGTATLPLPDRATIGNMAPEYGATMGFFPVDEKTCDYLIATGRTAEHVDMFRNYYKAQELFGIPKLGDCEYTQTLSLDLNTVKPSVAGPKRPQDRIDLTQVGNTFTKLFSTPVSDSGYGKQSADLTKTFTSTKDPNVNIKHGDVLIAAITSCTNTSNPSVMIAAGLLAKKAFEKGLKVKPLVKTSLAPGSRIVTEYLEKTGLQHYLNELGFQLVGYGCTTCIGNSGPLHPDIEEVVVSNDLVCASVLSGNRNFEARVHQNIKGNFLMSPPLVVAYALAGNVNFNWDKDSLGKDQSGKDVYLKDIWPSLNEISVLTTAARDPKVYQKLYSDFESQNAEWKNIKSPTGVTFTWDNNSTYIQHPPYFENFSITPIPVKDIIGARALAIFGDSVTTDHISPAGAIKASSPAGLYLQHQGVQPKDFNSYGARRGNHEVMVRGTFANVRIKNLMAGGAEGGITRVQPSGQATSIYDAAIEYEKQATPLIVFAGQEYGTGSSRDWAAKGTRLLGVRAVIAQSFERIHRSNLVGMGVVPCQFLDGESAATYGLTGEELFELKGLEGEIKPRQTLVLKAATTDGKVKDIPVRLRIDTSIEVEYFKNGGILPYVLRQIV
mgnify:CR=1 FL=1